MYEITKFVFIGILVLLGVFMAICPKQAVKQEKRENEESLAATRKKGIMLAGVAGVCGVIFAVIEFTK